MHLVEAITAQLQNHIFTGLTESEIKREIGKARKDYGTTNNTLRRLIKHGIIVRKPGVSKSTGIPSWIYQIIVDPTTAKMYIKKQRAKMEKHLNRRRVFEFGIAYDLTTAFKSGPLMIGRGAAPDELKGKCLIVSSDYEMVTEEFNGNTVIYFKKK